MKFVKMVGMTALMSMMALSTSSCATWSQEQQEQKTQQDFATNTVLTGQAETIRQDALSGDPDAEYAIGYMYYYGQNGLPKNLELAQSWIAKAAAQGQPQAVQAIALIQKAQHPMSASTTMANVSNTKVNTNFSPSTPSINKIKTRIQQGQIASLNSKKPSHYALNNSVNSKPSKPKPSTPKPIKIKTNLTSEENKLLKEPANTYTLQLVGRDKKSAVVAFLNQSGLANKALIYHTYFHGKDWYVATYGVYHSDHQATLAIKELPKSVQKVGPWVKPLSLVQKEILEKKVIG